MLPHPRPADGGGLPARARVRIHEERAASPLLEASILTELLIILALVLANGLFAGAEIAIINTRKTRLKELSDGGSRAAHAVLRLREEPVVEGVGRDGGCQAEQ